MTDSSEPTAASRCPWCSAEVTGDPVHCPACGAALRESTADDIPGVTQIDPSASARSGVNRRRLPGWLGGERDEETDSGKVEPPSPEVMKEMLRLELAALDAEIEAKAQQVAAERELSTAEAGSEATPPPEGEDAGASPG